MVNDSELLMVADNFFAIWNPFEMIIPKCHSWLLDKVKKNVDSEENLSVPKLKKILKCQI